jgi:hypothetical protein
LRGELGTLEKSVRVTLYERHPGFAILTTSYHNTSDAPLRLARWVNCAHHLPTAGDGAPFGAFSGASHEDRRDWVQRAAPGFEQALMGITRPTTEAGRRSWTSGVATSGSPSDTSKRSRGS